MVASMSLVALSVLSGCGGGSSPEPGLPSSNGNSAGGAVNKPKAAAANAVAFPQNKATATIMGTVSLDGQAPVMKPIDMSGAMLCAAQHKTKVLKEEIVAQSGKLANAVVYVKSVDGKALEDVWTFNAPAMAATLDQKDCMYVPHVLAIQADQTLNIRSSDDMAHNVHYTGENSEFNVSFTQEGEVRPKTFSQPELGGKIVCNVHAWMNASLNVFAHPFFCVTKDDGAYVLPKLPPGEYELALWHESANDSGKLIPADAVKVKVGDNTTTTQDFSLKVK